MPFQSLKSQSASLWHPGAPAASGFLATRRSHNVRARDEASGVQRMKIGVAGLGAMGSAIAARLLEVGHQVTVWNRTAAKVKPLTDAGAAAVADPVAVAAASDTVITILTDGAAIDAVYH